MTAGRNSLNSALSVQPKEMNNAIDTKEDAVAIGFKTSNSVPFQEIINQVIQQTDPNADEKLWQRLAYPSPHDAGQIEEAITPLKEKLAHSKNLTGREFFVLGNYYYTFICNYSAALHCFQQAESLGDVGALNNLGLIYLDGKGSVINKSIAKEYFDKAIAKGNLLAHVNLYQYFLDMGDSDKAEESLRQASLSEKSLCLHAMFLLANIFEKKIHNNNPLGLAPSYLLEKLGIMKTYLENSAANGSLSALYKLATLHHKYDDLDYRGLGLNSYKSIEYFRLLIPYSQHFSKSSTPEEMMALIYHVGKNIKDLNQAAKYYFKACERNQENRKKIEKRLRLLLSQIKSLTYEGDDFYEMYFYVALLFDSEKWFEHMGSCHLQKIKYRKMPNNSDGSDAWDTYRLYDWLDKKYSILGRQRTDDQEYLFDMLAEENLDYFDKRRYLHNKSRQPIIKTITDKIVERDKLVASHILPSIAPIVSSYLLGNEGHKVKEKNISFFKSRDKNYGCNDKNTMMQKNNKCVIS